VSLSFLSSSPTALGHQRRGAPTGTRALRGLWIGLASAVVALLLAGQASAASPAALFGFNDNAVGQGLTTPGQDAAKLSSIGADVARVTLDWRWAEPKPGTYDFSRADAIYAAELSRGIRPLFVVLWAPSWALDASTPCDQYREDCHLPPGPAHDGDWARFLAAVATRYPGAAAIELWNEPNLVQYWQPKPDVVRYTQLLKVGFQAIKTANPSMTVLSGGLSNLQTSDAAGNVKLRSFIAGMYANGAKGSMDGISFHPYPRSANDALLYQSFDDVRDLRDYYGDAGTPLWVTEAGVSTTGANPFTESQQARVSLHLYQTIKAMPDVRAVLLHTLFETAAPATSVERGFGVVHSDGSPKPAYCLLAAERATTYSCPPSVSVPLMPDAVAEADWTAQRLVHTALDAARGYYAQHHSYLGLTSANLHDLDPLLSALSPAEAARPGVLADPSQIRVYTWSPYPNDLIVCNASKATYAYCIYVRRGRFSRYNRDSSSIGGAWDRVAHSADPLNW